MYIAVSFIYQLKEKSLLEQINEEGISTLVDTFYKKVRKDVLLGDVFNTVIKDWDTHLVKIKDFWNSLLLGTKTYSGNPFMKHMGLKTKEISVDNKVILENGHTINSSITIEHFKAWLDLFNKTAKEIFVESEANKIMEKANMIGKSLQKGMFVENSL